MAGKGDYSEVTRIILDRLTQVETSLRGDINAIHVKMDAKFGDVYEELYKAKTDIVLNKHSIKSAELDHENCPGIKAETKLNTKGMTVLQVFVNNPILVIIMLALLLGIDVYTIITNLVK